MLILPTEVQRKKFALELTAWMNSEQLTMKEVAELFNVDRRTVNYWLDAKTMPSTFNAIVASYFSPGVRKCLQRIADVDGKQASLTVVRRRKKRSEAA